MCSRYYVELSPELRPIIEAARGTSIAVKMVHDLAKPIIMEGEVRPADIAPVIAPNSKGVRSVFPMIWGFLQSDYGYSSGRNSRSSDGGNTGSSDNRTARSSDSRRVRSHPLFNARSETADSKPTFRECWQRRRCVIPASYYFEWSHGPVSDGGRIPAESLSPAASSSSAEKISAGKTSAGKTTKTAYAIQPAGSSITWLAGLYRIENGFPYFTVLTREAVGEAAAIHDRMPLILPEELVNDWIDPATPAAAVKEISRSALTNMIIEKI